MSKKTIYFCITIICFVFISNCFADSNDLSYKEGELLVRFAPKADGKQKTVQEHNQILASIGGGTVKRSFTIVPGLTVVKLPENSSVEKTLPTFRSSQAFLYVEPNYKIKLLSTIPNDPNFQYQWGLYNTGQYNGTPGADIDAPEAWGIRTDSNIIVAVIDSGVDYTHPDLAPNMWTDANGLYGYDFTNDDNDPNDDNFHGTHVAGIIGARGNNGIGVAGVCWNVKIMALKILDFGGSGDPYGWIDDAVGAIQYAVQHGAKVLNNSWGWTNGTYVQGIKDAIDAANANGVLFVAAVGNSNNNNDTYPVYPASYNCNNIISVMATDRHDVRSIWPLGSGSSNYGPNSVDLGAPGTDILSTFPTSVTHGMPYYGFDTTYYETLNGTSMAAPYVAGACALVWAADPNLTHLQVKDAILSSVDHLSSLNGKCVTGGRLNLFNALDIVKPIYLAQTDDANTGGVKPGDRLMYTISYDYNRPGWTQPLTNVVITDYLPAEVLDTNVVRDHNGVYDSTTHTVTWNLGTLNYGSNGSVTVTVTVGNTRPPTGYMLNTAKITADQQVVKTTVTRLTLWCKVHNETKGFWRDKIQSAITDADNNDVIVAYPSTYTENITFGSSGKLIMLQSSNPADPCIVASTIIGSANGSHTVTFTNNSSTVNGFTIAMATGYSQGGVYCNGSGSAPTITNCLIRDNRNGVYCYNLSAPTIKNCTITDNSYNGISCNNAGQVKITNNWIVNNGYDALYGIELFNTTCVVTIRNSTICNNAHGGIYSDGGIADPNISNCIIWGNGGASLSDPFMTFNKVNYCCISGSTASYSGTGNITTDPCFVAGDYHLKFGSLCRNNGDPNRTYDINETDIDGQPRRNGTGRVDIGGDEFYATTDFNADLTTNFLDYAVFANSWRTYPGNIKWNAACDFIDNNNVDINDLAWFAQDWPFPPPTEPQSPAPGPSPPPPPPAVVYLAYEGSMTPDPNTEVTVYVYSDITLSSMDMVVTVTGDANITTAMGSYDCNQYGWDSEWGWDPYIDNGWVEFGGVSEAGQATGTVGYFKFIYNSGQVSVSITADSYVYDANSQPAAFSTDPLIFGGESMQSGQQQSMMQSSLLEESAAMDSTQVDVNELADWLEKIWLEDAELRTTTTHEEWQQFIDDLRSGQYQ